MKSQLVGTIQRPGQKPENIELVVDKRPNLTRAERAAGIEWVNGDYDPGNVMRYGAVGDGDADDTLAIERAISVVKAGGGGDVFLPSGDYAVSSISAVWTSAQTVNIRGEGKMSTILRKIDSSTTPILDLSAASLVESYSSISDLRIIGNSKNHDGIKITLLARFDIDRVRIEACDTALNSVGALVFSGYDLTIQSNNIGYKCRKSGTIYANLVQFFGGQMSANTDFGMDIGEAAGVHLYGTDLSANGTSADTSTGAIFIRNTVDDESGLSIISLNNCWLENNLGMAIDVDDSNLCLSLNNTLILGSQSGNAMDVGDIRSLVLNNVMAASVGDTITTAAKNSTVIGGQISTYTDNSTQSSSRIGAAFSSGTSELTSQIIRLTDGISTPGTASGFASLYVDSTDGDLKVRFGDGAIRTVRIDAANQTYTTGAHSTLRDFTGTTTAAEALQLLETLVDDLKTQGILS